MVEGMPVVLGLGIVTSAVVLVLIGLRLRLFGRLRSWIAKPYIEHRLAARRAEALLRDLLTPEEYSNLRAKGYLEVASREHPGRVYHIARDGMTLISRENGRFSTSFCVGPETPLPAADVVAAHKLMLEGAEAEYLKIANVRMRFEDRS